jgi:hypothetical protein
LAPDKKDLVKRYLGIVELLLTETDALVREDLLKLMLSQRIYISFLVRKFMKVL